MSLFRLAMMVAVGLLVCSCHEPSCAVDFGGGPIGLTDVQYSDSDGSAFPGYLTVGNQYVVHFCLACSRGRVDIYRELGPPTISCGCAPCHQISAMPDGECARVVFQLDSAGPCQPPVSCLGWMAGNAGGGSSSCLPVHVSGDAGSWTN